MHETDYQRARRQKHEVKKYGITGNTPEDAVKRIKKHTKGKAVEKALDSANKDLEDKVQVKVKTNGMYQGNSKDWHD